MTYAITKIRTLITVERAIDLVTLVTSLLVADSLYVFHQFTLEAIAFLGTWYVSRAAVRFVALRRG